MPDDDTAQAAYHGFCRTRGRTPGKDAPLWKDVPADTKVGWRGAVQGVIRALWIGGNDGDAMKENEG